MNANARIFYAIQELIWGGKRPEEIKAIIKEAWEEAARQEQENHLEALRRLQ